SWNSDSVGLPGTFILGSFQDEREVVGVAVAPLLAGLGGADDRMAALTHVRRGVPVRRAVAATDLAAGVAHAQVHPAAADLQALLAALDLLRQLGELDRVEVGARCTHFARSAAIRSGLHLLQPWKADRSSPASQASC